MKTFYNDFMVNNSATHLWFMYPLIGMLISTPFLAKMFQTMKDQEIEIFFLVAILWNIVSIYLTLDIGVGFSYSGWILSGYIIYYFAGYFCKRIINDNNKKIMYTLGIIGFIVSVFGRQFWANNFHNGTDLSVAYVFFTMATYIFLSRKFIIKSCIVKKIFGFIAKHSFTEYMLHYAVIDEITTKVVKEASSPKKFVEAVVITLGASFALAVVLDICIINPIQKFMRKKFL